MNEQWLLTREEWEEACGNLPEGTTCGGCQKALARAQLRKVAEKIRAMGYLGGEWRELRPEAGLK